jgi:hypothetical protein
VNALALGSIATARSDAHLAAMPAAGREHFETEIRLLQPLGRLGEPAEVADVAAFLLSDASRFLNGAVIPVDDGRSALGRDPEEARPGAPPMHHPSVAAQARLPDPAERPGLVQRLGPGGQAWSGGGGAAGVK